MRNSQVEIKAIQAKLRSIHADQSTAAPSRSQHSPQTTQAVAPHQARYSTPLSDPWSSDRSTEGSREFTEPSSPSPSPLVQSGKSAHAANRLEVDLPPLSHSSRLSGSTTRLQGFPNRPQPVSPQPVSPVDWEPIPSPPQPEPIATRLDRLQQKSMHYLHQLAQSNPHAQPDTAIDVALQRLQVQAQQINQLSATQEAAILELKAIADQIEQDWRSQELSHAARSGYEVSALEIPPLCQYDSASLPQVEKNDEGIWVLTGRSIDLFKAEREAALTAQALRYRTLPHLKPQPSWTQRFSQWMLGATQGKRQHPAHTRIQSRKRKVQSFRMRESMTLLVGAVVVRVLLNVLLSAHPMLWFPAIALMVTPGAVALYRSTVTPRSTLTWGYRLIAIMIGFWIGGRL